MISLHLKPIFQARGIDNPFTFLVKSGFTRHTAHLLLNGKTLSFQLRHIEQLCAVLHCTPNDLLAYVPEANSLLPETHPLHALKRKPLDLQWQETIKTMPLDQLQQLTALLQQKRDSAL